MAEKERIDVLELLVSQLTKRLNRLERTEQTLIVPMDGVTLSVTVLHDGSARVAMRTNPDGYTIAGQIPPDDAQRLARLLMSTSKPEGTE